MQLSVGSKKEDTVFLTSYVQ
jgi:hypothetical protein